MNKHAYLIMVHNELCVFENLIKLLDDERNDLYIHVDSKLKNFDEDKYNKIIKKANITFIKRTNVKWGTIKQIKCMLSLLIVSTKTHHLYYHFISGSDLPIKTQDYIHAYCNKSNKDFIGFDNTDLITEKNLERIKYYHLFGNHWRESNKFISKLFQFLRANLMRLQKHLKVNRLKNLNIEFRKGCNWFSITENTALYILSKKEYLKYFKYSYCADELFVQTIVYNSNLKNNISYNDMRYIDWNKGSPWVLRMEDYKAIMDSKMFFARKFSSSVDLNVIEKIYSNVKKESK